MIRLTQKLEPTPALSQPAFDVKLVFLVMATIYFSNAGQMNRYARMMAEDLMREFKDAVESKNRDLLLKLFHLSNASDAKVAKVFSTYQGYKFKVRTALFVDTHRIRSNVYLLPAGGGEAVSEIEFGLEENTESPTGWKIMTAKIVKLR